MQLKSFSIAGFRSLAHLIDIQFQRLTVFIGENDAGKTAILDALEILLTNKSISESDFHRLNDVRATECVISACFTLGEADAVPSDMRVSGGKELEVKKTINAGGARYQVNGLEYVDERWSTFDKVDAAGQRELIASKGLSPAANTTLRAKQRDEILAAGQVEKISKWKDIAPPAVLSVLPRFERIASADFKQPDTMIQRVMQGAVNDCLRPADPVTGERAPIQELAVIDTKVRAALNAKAEEMQAILKGANPRIIAVEVAPTIDYAKGVTSTSLMMDAGSGLRSVSAHGEGSKKRLWMGLLEWERKAQREASGTATIRVYDEPDVNLDYVAERQLFASILEDASAPEGKIQLVVCTHTMTLVDRAPADAINLLVVADNEERKIERLRGDTDDDVREFIANISRSIGLTNSALFYEKAFLLVEGESEESALPVLYKNIYGRSMFEDGIVLVNLFSCSAWKGLLKMMLANRATVTTILLDQDCREPESSGYMTAQSLAEVGYPEDYVTSSCFFIGEKEFEDAFHTEDICAVLCEHWPRQNGEAWSNDEIDALRVGEKLSTTLMQTVRQTCELARRSSARKPAFALRLAEHCRGLVQIPGGIQRAFECVRQQAGISDGGAGGPLARPVAQAHPVDASEMVERPEHKESAVASAN